MKDQKVSLRKVLDIIDDKCREIDRGLKGNFDEQDKVIGRKLVCQMDIAYGLYKKIKETFSDNRGEGK